VGVTDLYAFDPRPDRMKEASDQSGCKPCRTLEEGLDRAPQLAVIATPNSFHMQPALAAARRGCHLFIEKPLSHSMEGVKELLAEVKTRKLAALIGCNMRFHPGVALTMELAKEGAIGRIVCTRVMAGSYLPEWHPWEDYRQGYSARADLGGGVILDGIHEIDYLLDLLGPVQSVTCEAGRCGNVETQTENTAEILVWSKTGALANIHLDYVQRAYRRSCLLTGTEGTLEWDFHIPRVRLFRAASKTWEEYPLPYGEVNAMYIAQARHLLACIEGRESPAQDIEAASKALQVAIAAKESARTGRRIQLDDPSAKKTVRKRNGTRRP